MQTALLETYTALPLIASLLVQGASGLFLFRIAKQFPNKITSPSYIKLASLFIALLGLNSIVAIFIPSLLIFSTGVFIANIVFLAFLILAGKNLAQIRIEEAQTQEIATVTENDADNGEDPLIEVGRSVLSYVSESITGEINLVRLLDFVNQTQMAHTKADGGVIFLADDFDDLIAAKSFAGNFPPPYKLPVDLPHKPVRVETNFRYTQFALGETIFGEVASTGKPALIVDGEKDSRIFSNGPEEFLKPGSYIVVPLMVKDKVVGVSGLARLPENAPFGEAELRTATILAGFAGAAINNIFSVQEILERADLEREASIASQIQKTLHPKRLPELPEIGFGSFFNSTKGVCGDYYDIILARRDRIAVAIADVAGKGIQSSMVMIMLRSILHLVTNTTKSAGTILDWVNKGITGKIDMDHYATLTYISFSPEDHTLEYATAGHQPMLIWRADSKQVETIHQKTDPIGIERSSTYAEMKLTVGKGDIIILFTDGLIEALNRDGKQYGIETLSKTISASTHKTAKEIASDVKHHIQAFIGSASLHDDQTLVIMKIKA